MRVVVAGGGVGGLAVALAVGRAGHAVTIYETDPLPIDPSPDAAFASHRSGAPQAHQTHGFLARIGRELREHAPDVLADLHAAGCFTLPTTVDLGDARPDDEDLAVLVVRRTTFEWVLRRAALAEPNVSIETASVAGFTWISSDRVPRVTGVRLADGAAVDADVVVSAVGRRGGLTEWLAAGGVDVVETVHPSGLMYLTRWYRRPGADADIDPKLGGDLGFVKFLAVPGDGHTLSITLAIRPEDSELRTLLSDPDGFDRACALLPGPDQFFRDGPPPGIGGVRPMGGLLNRRRAFLDESGAPVVLGVHAVGDAHTCTNPLYGRGCTLALIEAFALAEVLAEHPDNPDERTRAYEAVCATEVLPSYEVAVQLDRMGADPAGRVGSGSGADADPATRALGAVFNAAATDAVIGRGILRFWNLLASFEELMADTEFMTRALEVMANPDAYPPPESPGPRRSELLTALAAGSPGVDA